MREVISQAPLVLTVLALKRLLQVSEEVDVPFPTERTDGPPENGNPRGAEEEEEWDMNHRTKAESSRRHQKEGMAIPWASWETGTACSEPVGRREAWGRYWAGSIRGEEGLFREGNEPCKEIYNGKGSTWKFVRD